MRTLSLRDFGTVWCRSTHCVNTAACAKTKIKCTERLQYEEEALSNRLLNEHGLTSLHSFLRNDAQ